MHPLVSIFAFLGLALAAPTQNNTTTTTLTMVTNPTTVPHASPSTTTSTVPSSTPCPILIENTPWLLTNITHFTPSFPSQNHSNSNSSTTSFSASSPSSSPSLSTSSFSTSLTSRFISFHFRDTNKGLKLETRCFRTLPRRHSDEVDEKPGGGTYYPCEDGRVRFAYTPTVEGKGEGEGEGELKVGRGYRDDCLGKPPYNYLVAYGKQTLQLANMTTTWTNTTSTSTSTDPGVWSWLERLEMKITAVT